MNYLYSCAQYAWSVTLQHTLILLWDKADMVIYKFYGESAVCNRLFYFASM